MLVLVAGCAVGPDYKAPAPKMPAAWRQPPDPAITPSEASVQRWWEVFGDATLSRLVARATTGNLDLKQAVARIKEARARVGVASGKYYPEASSAVDVSVQRGSKNQGATGEITGSYSLGLSASWEVDLFGRVRRSVEAARADLQAAEEDHLDVTVALVAEVARVYLGVRTLQARVKATRENNASQAQVLELTRSRFRHGLATDLDVAQAEMLLASSEADLPLLDIELVRAKNALAQLLGQRPGDLEQELRQEAPIPVPPVKVAVGLPASLLRQRPDIRRTERQLAAQTARIGVATADLYPSFSIAGTIGLASLDAAQLFTLSSGLFSVGPSVTWNVFQGGRIRSNIKVQEALREQAQVAYEKAVLNALVEVENALAAFRQQDDRVRALERALASARRALKMALQLYKDGLTDFQTVLDAQRSVLSYETQLASGRGEAATNLVLLYKALGGGWPGPGQAKK